jgi:hypothetical protein
MSIKNKQFFLPISNLWKKLEKVHPEKVIYQKICLLVVPKRTDSHFQHFFDFILFVCKFFAFFSTVSKLAENSNPYKNFVKIKFLGHISTLILFPTVIGTI